MIVPNLRRFVVGFNLLNLTREQVLAFFDTRPEVLNWYTILPGEVYVISDRSSSELAFILRQRFPYQYFSVAEIANVDGAMPAEVWDFLNNAQPSVLRVGSRTSGKPPLPPDLKTPTP